MRNLRCRWQRTTFNPLFAVIVSKVPQDETANSHLSSSRVPNMSAGSEGGQEDIEFLKDQGGMNNFAVCMAVSSLYLVFLFCYSTKTECSVESVSKEISTSDSGRCSRRFLFTTTFL